MAKTTKKARDEAWDLYYKTNSELEMLERQVKTKRYLNDLLRKEAVHAQEVYDRMPEGVIAEPEITTATPATDRPPPPPRVRSSYF